MLIYIININFFLQNMPKLFVFYHNALNAYNNKINLLKIKTFI